MRNSLLELTGNKIGRLTVISGPFYVADASWKRRKSWECKCDCGKTSYPSDYKLKMNIVVSCGCLREEKVLEKLVKHGETLGRKKPSVEYVTWASMRDRCQNSNNPNWRYYGGRGIRVCERWSDFENFLADMGRRPLNLSLDRYPNPDGNYEPGNCRWATLSEQAKNKAPNLSGFQKGNTINLGRTHSEETKAKLRIISSSRTHNEETKAKLRAYARLQNARPAVE